MKFYRPFVLLLFLLVCINAAAANTIADYIIDTDLGGDVDDVLALLVALHEPVKPLAVTTTHIEPVEKARIAKLIMSLQGYATIPVYAGIGTLRTDSRTLFLSQNPLWPPSFGYPEPSATDSQWFMQQAIPYKRYAGPLFDTMQIEQEPAPAFIARIARHYSPQHKLVIIAIGPLHNIAAALMIDPVIKDNIVIYSMGGIYPKGYNWLVSPETTSTVLSQVETHVVLSQFINDNDFTISADEFDLLATKAQGLGLAIIQDWKNWYKMDKTNRMRTHLSDPVTLYLALHDSEISEQQRVEIKFPCLDEYGHLKAEFYGLWYNQPGLENKLMSVQVKDNSAVSFISHVQDASAIRRNILSAISAAISG